MKHIPVLLEEVIEGLNLKPRAIIVDGTVGYGGHSEEMLNKLNGKAKLIGFDRDSDAIKFTKNRLSKFKNVLLINDSYQNASIHLQEQGIEAVDAILLDLGVSSPQLDQPQRGFTFKEDALLDMRFDVDSQLTTAADILNTYQEKDLVRIFKEYGEEKYSSKIAKSIIQYREVKRITSTKELAYLIEESIPRRFWPKNIHPATKTFQALRIEVNKELDHLSEALPKLVDALKPGGRIAIISFHSLEDRIVKNFFKEAQRECICPKSFPVCTCENKPSLKVITKKPLMATKTEIKNNIRSRSAKLRVAERI